MNPSTHNVSAAWMRRYGWLIIVYVVVTTGTEAWFMGDTVYYASQIWRNAHGLDGQFWEFGHVWWRPLGYAVFVLLGPLVREVVGTDQELGLIFSLIVINWLAGLASVMLMFELAARTTVHVWIARLVTVSFILTQAFLNFTQTGSSYIPGLALLLTCLYFLSKPEAPTAFARHSLWAGMALAGSLALWATYLWAVPAALLFPFFWFGADLRPSRLVIRTALVFGLSTGAIFVTGALNAGVRTVAEAHQWITEAAHGMIGGGLPQVAFGLARSLIHMGNDGLLFKRFLLQDPFNPVSAFDLFKSSLLKLALFYLFLAMLLANLSRTVKGRRIFKVWIINAVPVLAFALSWDGGSIERYLALYPVTFMALAYLLENSNTQTAFKWVAATLIVVMLHSNLSAMSTSTLALKRETVIARVSAMHIDNRSTIVTPHFQDELVNFRNSFPFDPINRQAKWRLMDLVSPGNEDAVRWRQKFAAVALSTWQRGGELWLAKRALVPKPRPEWAWVEGNDGAVSWKDFPIFFADMEMGRSVGGEDGFILLPRTPLNEGFLLRFRERSAR